MKNEIPCLALCLALAVVFSSCARRNYFPGGNVQTGIASWYGTEFHGRSTSNKEIYDMYDMTAAHKTLPFGTIVAVTNLANGRTVTVRINDRGPFVKERIIDLSYAAARVLGLVGPGTTPVRLEILKNVSPKPGRSRHSVQVGSFIARDNAVGLMAELKKKYGDVYISLFKTPAQTYYRVRIKAKNAAAAEKIARALYRDGYTVIVLEEQ